MWALLIGIDDYARHPSLTGCSADVSSVRHYLETDLSVPPANIITLTNKHATRATILHNIRRHLVDNPSIRYGDARILYFAGHGSRALAPISWPMYSPDDDSEKRIIELIIPHDESLPDTATGQRIPGIPGRTVAAMLRMSSLRHGDNITVILDCCYTGTRDPRSQAQPTYTRGIHPAYVSPLLHDIDDDILRAEPSSPVVSSLGNTAYAACTAGGFLEPVCKGHVALKACDAGEIATGDDEGGFFTRYLLWALRNPHIRPLSYSEVLRAIGLRFEKRRTHDIDAPPQHPLCHASNPDRQFFTEHAHADCFAAHAGPAPDLCIVEGGDAEGVRANTVFDLYEHPSLHCLGRVVAVATAMEVFPSYCLAKLDVPVPLQPGTSAIVVGRPLKYAVSSTVHASHRVTDTVKRVRGYLTSPALAASPDYELVPVHAADVILVVDGQGITLQRRDDSLRRLDTCAPRLFPQYLPHALPGVLRRVARFNSCLSRCNPRRPFADDVVMELRRIVDVESATTGYSLGAKLGKAVPWKNQEATVPHDQDALYSLVLRNYTNTPLYPYVYWFDPATYGIDEFYTPSKFSALRPNRSLELGLSHGSHALAFVVNEGEFRDTGFLKCILTTEPLSTLSDVQQEPILGRDDFGQLYMSKHVSSEPTGPAPWHCLHKAAEWDTITRKVTVLGLGQEDVE